MSELQINLFEDLGEDLGEDLPEVHLGDLFQLGDNRLLCGDATKREDVLKLTGGNLADLVFTDPPYGMKKEADGVTNDNLNFDDLLEFNKKWIPLSFEALKPTGSWYCWGMDEPLMDIYSEILRPMKRRTGRDKLTFRNLITWDKGPSQGMLSGDLRMYPPGSEKCLFVMMGRQTYGQTIADYWEGFEPIRKKLDEERKKTGLTTDELVKLAGATSITHWWSKSQWNFPSRERYEQLQRNLRRQDYDGFRQDYDELRQDYDELRQDYDELRQDYDELRQEFYRTRGYFDNTWKAMTDVWRFPLVASGSQERKDAGNHPTVKPVALCRQAIMTSSRPGEVVLDLFGGSGSTMIAANAIGRKAWLMEIDPGWCQQIIRRWRKFSKEKEVRIE